MQTNKKDCPGSPPIKVYNARNIYSEGKANSGVNLNTDHHSDFEVLCVPLSYSDLKFY
jgi:hypothetical protein